MNSLPIDDVLPALRDALAIRHEAVLEAPPGAGKTTRVPLALLNEPWLAGQTIYSAEYADQLLKSGKTADLNNKPIGTGPFIFVRYNIGQNPGEPNLLDVLPPDRYTILPNTAGCYDAVEAAAPRRARCRWLERCHPRSARAAGRD